MLVDVILVIALLVFFGIGFTYLMVTFYLRLTKREVFVPFVPADPKGIAAMCNAVGLKGSERVIDIGSGWGTMIFFLAQKYPKLHLVGVEINPILHICATFLRSIRYRKHDISLICRDAALVPLDSFDVVFLFMLSSYVNTVLVPKFERELPQGAKVVSYVFPMKSDAFSEEKIELPSHGWKSTVYVYTKK